MAGETKPCIHVCVTCQGGAPGEATGGQRLYEALAAQLPEAAPVVLNGVNCLANCTRGCSAALTGAGKWSYLLGDLSADLADDLLTYAGAYARSSNGTVMPSRRPASLRDIVVGRIPGAGMAAAQGLAA